MNTKQLATRWFEELWNKKNPEVIAEIMDASAVGVTEGGVIHGPGEFRASVYEPFVKAFPDLKVKIEGVLAEGDDVALRWTASATHTGPLLHVSPSGRPVKFSGITWLTFKGGKLVKGSDSYNFHGLMAYLGGGQPTASVHEA
jgi:predicted ester cyclase